MSQMPEWLDTNLLTSVALAGLALLAMRALPRLLAGVPFVPPQEVKDALEARSDVLILDVRTPSEYGGGDGHIPGALNLPLDQLSGRLGAIRDQLQDYVETPVYVYCRTTNRASSAARSLKKAGLKQVRVIAGGMGRWAREGHPRSTGA